MTYEQIEYQGVTYDITAHGLVSEIYRKRNRKDNGWNLDEQPSEAHVARCTAWLQKFATPRKAANLAIDSYSLKHLVERWDIGRCQDNYVSNGALILAAHRLGFKILPDGPLSPNVTFYLSYAKDSLK